MFLSDEEIKVRGEEIFTPFNPNKVQPASYDVSLSNDILIPGIRIDNQRGIDLRVDNPKDFMKKIIMGVDGFHLPPGSCVLGSTTETIRCPADLAVSIIGKSSLARLFLVPQLCAGWLDPGFEGQITLELTNHGPWTILLYPGMGIAQINFAKMSKPASRPYGSEGLGSHYHKQMGVTASIGNRGK